MSLLLFTICMRTQLIGNLWEPATIDMRACSIVGTLTTTEYFWPVLHSRMDRDRTPQQMIHMWVLYWQPLHHQTPLQLYRLLLDSTLSRVACLPGFPLFLKFWSVPRWTCHFCFRLICDLCCLKGSLLA